MVADLIHPRLNGKTSQNQMSVTIISKTAISRDKKEKLVEIQIQMLSVKIVKLRG